MKKRVIIDINEFLELSIDNKSCQDYLYKIRFPKGITCIKCGGKQFYKIFTRNIYECKCGYQMSVTAGTIMHGSHLPLIDWFRVIFQLIPPNKFYSIQEIKKDLKVSYQTAWRIRRAILKEMDSDEDSFIKEMFKK